MPKLKISAVFIFVSVILIGCNDDADSSNTPTKPDVKPIAFNFVEGTIKQLHTSIKTGGITCHAAVQGYLDRIQAYDKTGPTLNSVITVNTNALNEADRQDAYFKSTGNLTGPLHCVTVLAKDNFDTDDMPTSAGSLALQNSQPEHDSFVIKKIKDNGGIIIGKANLDEFAFGFQGNSSHPNGGQAKNAYDLSKGPGGSSSGTGTSIAASFAMVGLGTDTGGSVRVPSAVEGLFGLRPSLRLVSQSGIIPLAPFQDTAGPICRTVEDCALLMDSLVGYDLNASSNQRADFAIESPLMNNLTEYQSRTNIPRSYQEALQLNSLVGVRVGIVRDLFSKANTEEIQLVNEAVNKAIEQLKAAGATVEDVTIDDLNTILTRYSSLSSFQFKTSLTAYLQSWPSSKDNHFRSYDEVLNSGLARSNFSIYNTDLTTPQMQAAYQLNSQERPSFVRTRILSALDNKTLAGVSKGQAYDVLLYPTIQGLAANLGGSPTTGTANRLSPFSGFPAMNLPAGMVKLSMANNDLPVGMEILGREFAEPTLFKVAYGWEQFAKPRQAPTHTPELSARR